MATATRQAQSRAEVKVKGTVYFMVKRDGKWADRDTIPYRNSRERLDALVEARSYFDMGNGSRRVVNEYFDKDNRKRHEIVIEFVAPADAEVDAAAEVVSLFDWMRESTGLEWYTHQGVDYTPPSLQ